MAAELRCARSSAQHCRQRAHDQQARSTATGSRTPHCTHDGWLNCAVPGVLRNTAAGKHTNNRPGALPLAIAPPLHAQRLSSSPLLVSTLKATGASSGRVGVHQNFSKYSGTKQTSGHSTRPGRKSTRNDPTPLLVVAGSRIYLTIIH